MLNPDKNNTMVLADICNIIGYIIFLYLLYDKLIIKPRIRVYNICIGFMWIIENIIVFINMDFFVEYFFFNLFRNIYLNKISS